MAKEKSIIAKQLPDTNEVKKVKPIIKSVTVTPMDNKDVHEDIEIPNGYAYVVPLIDGREDTTQAFFYPLRNVDKIYGNERFVIKKKGNQ